MRLVYVMVLGRVKNWDWIAIDPDELNTEGRN